MRHRPRSLVVDGTSTTFGWLGPAAKGGRWAIDPLLWRWMVHRPPSGPGGWRPGPGRAARRGGLAPEAGNWRRGGLGPGPGPRGRSGPAAARSGPAAAGQPVFWRPAAM